MTASKPRADPTGLWRPQGYERMAGELFALVVSWGVQFLTLPEPMGPGDRGIRPRGHGHSVSALLLLTPRRLRAISEILALRVVLTCPAPFDIIGGQR